nr:hypothetical protein [uncultured Oscillibacter sp.]
MAWLWIPAVIVLLIALLCWTRVGVWAAFGGGELRLDVKFGLLRIHILPAKPKKPKAEKPKKEKKKPKEEPGAEKPESKFSFTLEDGEDALRTMLPPLKRALRRFGRGIRIKPLRLSLVLGGEEDPAAAAQLYGEIQAAVWTGMPLLERLLDIRKPYIHTDVDFTASGTAVEGEAGVTLRVGTLLAMGFGLAFPVLGWFLRWRKRCKTRLPKPEKKPPEDPKPQEAQTENPAA